MNFQYNHIWAEENSHAVIENNYQQQFFVNVWVGVVVNGPYFFPLRLNGQEYRNFLEFVLPELLENVSLAERGAMWFMHDEASPHFSIVVRQFMYATYREN